MNIYLRRGDDLTPDPERFAFLDSPEGMRIAREGFFVSLDPPVIQPVPGEPQRVAHPIGCGGRSQ